MNRLRRTIQALLLIGSFVLTAGVVYLSRGGLDGGLFDNAITESSNAMMAEGRETFRFDTFGDEAFWTGALRLHEAIAGEDHGGVGPGLSPEAALGLGLKVDTDALPQEVLDAIAAGQVDLTDPSVTLTLLQADAVIGVKGTFQGDQLSAIGVTCAFCHSTVDDSFAPGLGKRLDGWANRDLDVGAVIAFAPDVSAISNLLGADEQTVRTVLTSWGPGKFDAELLMDGKAFRPDGKPAATLIPPAFGLAGVNLHTWTGWGSVTHWNGFVANLEMNGQGTFFDPRLDDPEKFPIAAREGFGHRRSNPDLVTPKLAALQFYQLAIPAPGPPSGLVDPAKAAAGEELFNGRAQCASCHVPPLFTEPGYNMHLPEEIGIDAFQAERSPDGRYRTAPLKGLWTHTKGGFYHDGRFETVSDVIRHYDQFFGLSLTPDEIDELGHYLLSLGDVEVAIGTGSEPATIPGASFVLEQNHPNPFSRGTTVTYTLDKAAPVAFEVFSVTGLRVLTIDRGVQPAGDHHFVWDGSDGAGHPVASGVYLYRLVVGDQATTRKMILLR